MPRPHRLTLSHLAVVFALSIAAALAAMGWRHDYQPRDRLRIAAGELRTLAAAGTLLAGRLAAGTLTATYRQEHLSRLSSDARSIEANVQAISIPSHPESHAAVLRSADAVTRNLDALGSASPQSALAIQAELEAERRELLALEDQLKDTE